MSLLTLLSLPLFVTAQQTLNTDSYRSTNGPVTGGNSAYNYVPTIMLDGVYKMWWCGQIPGDHGDNILYAESSSLDGPFASGDQPYLDVFGGTGSGSFDSLHTCDPSVVRVEGQYYLYYGAEQSDGAPTTIGVATGPDGVSWTRLNNDQPIISPANQQTTSSTYGAGQPSVIYLDSLFHIMFTDTTGAGSLSNGAGQFAWRSSDPTFQSNVEVATASGWQAMTTSNSRSFSIVNANSADWQYSDALEAFIIAHDNTAGETTLTFLDPNNLASQLYAEVQIAGGWSEGPGIVSRPDKHSVVSPTDYCGTIPIDVIRSTTGPPPNTLAHIGLDLLSGESCASMQSSQIAAILEGYGLSDDGLPAALVVGGLRLQIENAAVWNDLTHNIISVPDSIYYAVPYGASLTNGVTVLGASGLPAAFQLDGNTLWPISCIKAISDDNSQITTVSPATWESYPEGPSLYCV